MMLVSVRPFAQCEHDAYRQGTLGGMHACGTRNWIMYLMLRIVKNDTLGIDEGQTVIVDFGAAWCGPCVRLAPVYAISATIHEQYDHLTVDVDANPKLAQEYGIQSVPTLVIISGGKELGRCGNPGTLGAISNFISETLTNRPACDV